MVRTISVISILNIEHIVYNGDISTGGYNTGSSYLKDILQFNTASHTWEEVGQMNGARRSHAVMVLRDVSEICP